MPVAILETILSFAAILAALVKLVLTVMVGSNNSSRMIIKRKDGGKSVSVSDVRNDKDFNEILDSLSR